MGIQDYCYNKLRGKIVEKFGNVERFSKAFGETATKKKKKLSGKSEWTQSDIAKTISLLNISADKIPNYFFSQKVE